MSGKFGFKSLPFGHKLVYISAIVNVSVLGFVWVKRQIKMSQEELRQKEDMVVLTAEMDVGNWTESNRFKCFFAAQRYHMVGSTGPEDEKSPEVQRMLEVMHQCREGLYNYIPAETPSMRPLHAPPSYTVSAS
mmetsp:Transcript_87056/g.136286  ORF Transcript_87056/g.136286 Transcript_87056/m.136286 type:complete len:133 (+) Transcript_87056:87-485(+)